MLVHKAPETIRIKLLRLKWRIQSKLKKIGIKTPDQKRAFNELRKMQKTMNNAHFINLKLRIDGEWKEFEADYLKYLL